VDPVPSGGAPGQIPDSSEDTGLVVGHLRVASIVELVLLWQPAFIGK